jgi:hypothetical protein
MHAERAVGGVLRFRIGEKAKKRRKDLLVCFRDYLRVIIEEWLSGSRFVL